MACDFHRKPANSPSSLAVRGSFAAALSVRTILHMSRRCETEAMSFSLRQWQWNCHNALYLGPNQNAGATELLKRPRTWVVAASWQSDVIFVTARLTCGRPAAQEGTSCALPPFH